MGYLEKPFQHSRLGGMATDIRDCFSLLSPNWAHPSLEGLLLYCELMVNFMVEFKIPISRNRDAKALSDQICEKVMNILDNQGYQLHKRKNDGLIEILKKDALTANVAEELTDADATRAVLEYTHYGLKGKLKKKRELLRIIGQYVEPILQDAEMKGTYGWLTKDLGCCLNSLHIRHNNKEGDKANAVVQAMSDGELEECYDNTYREMLLLIELQRNLPFHRKVEGLREQLGGKKGGSAG